jgi:signal transduction histidine kinase
MLHDVRGSLGPIVSFADELDDLGRQLGDATIQQIANALKMQSMYAADLSRFSPQPSIFDVADLLRYLCNLNSSVLPDGFKVRFDEKGQKWVIRNEVVYAYRLFANIIANARRAALEAGGDVRVEMDGKEVRISNRFTGEPPGDAIYREGVSSKKEAESGRGLPSVLECAERLKVAVRHRCEGYTIIFTVDLPASLPGALE